MLLRRLMVRTFLTGSLVIRCAISWGSRVPLASKGNRGSGSASWLTGQPVIVVVVMRRAPGRQRWRG